MVSATQATVRAPFHAQGLPCFDDDVDAIAALAQVSRHRALLLHEPPPTPGTMEVPIAPGSGRFLSEAASLAALVPAGLPVIPHRVCRSLAEALAALEWLGAPVAVKACSEHLPHKSEHGLVHLGCRSPEAVREAYDACMSGLRRLGVDGEVIVAKMVHGRREFVLGAKVDAVFGPVVMVGDGGKYVEALPDVATLLPPFTDNEVVDALGRLRIAPLLAGVRGEPPLDVAAVAQAAVALGRLISSAQDAIQSVDVNPLIVGARGEGAWVVDALVERKA